MQILSHAALVSTTGSGVPGSLHRVASSGKGALSFSASFTRRCYVTASRTVHISVRHLLQHREICLHSAA